MAAGTLEDERAGGDGASVGHSHAHGPAVPVSAHLRKVIAAVLIPFAVAVLVGLVVLWPGGVPAHPHTGAGLDQHLRSSALDAGRRLPMGVLAGLFAAIVVLVGRWRGVAALVALAISFAVLSLFILPAVLRGADPLLVAIVGAGAIMLIALYLCHGLSARTSVAVLGTLVSLVLIGVLSLVFASWAHLTGNTSAETGLVHELYPGIEVRGLLLAGFVIGSLGVLFDVTVTQTSAVWELHQADPTMGTGKLYRTGMRIGRDHIASTVNTLVLAYAGAALPLLLLFSIAHRDVVSVATSELVAEEVARALVGSIGLVASVPVTTGLAALIAAADHPRAAAGLAGRHGHAR
ncbi:YibE/F family protein [Kitasatospora sp. NPDC058190]|uniref:YibE/F family protein n=1 Tax=Kitasatospora sp. NPDC058190 TaxID=3346371 RepID=UPI0036DD0358